MAEHAIKAISKDEDTFRMNGKLVRVGQDDSASSVDVGGLAIVDLKESLVKTTLAKNARFYRLKEVTGGFEEIDDTCPADVVKAVHCDGFWTGVRELSGISAVPVMRADGTIASEPGYDPGTKLILAPNCCKVSVPEYPTQYDAELAAARLADLFVDFPFEFDRKGISACVAGYLSLVGRPLIRGPVPMFLIDGNRAGSGKSLISDVLSEAAGLSRAPRKSLPGKDEEFRKTITGVASLALPLVLLDNISRPLGGDSLDAVLTANRWQDRWLGGNEIRTFDMRTVWFATGNNVVLSGDTYRRVLRIPLDCRIENPETRSGFKYPDLLGYVEQNREKLLSDALTILRAWHVAGRPDGGLDSWGSFEEFSRVVRGSLVYAGMSDPAPAADRLELATKSDLKRAAIPVLLNAWPSNSDGSPQELKSSEIAQLVETDRDLRDAIEQLLPSGKTELNSRSIGIALRTIKGQVSSGMRLIERDGRSRQRFWTVETVQK